MKKSQLLNLLLLSAVVVGCTDSPIDDSVSNATTIKREVVVGVGNGSKMSVTPEDGYWDIEWEATDQVVGWTELGEKSSFSVNEIYSDGRADIKGTISDMSEKMRFFYPYDAAFDGTIDLSSQTFDFAEEGYNSLGDATLYMLSDEFTIPDEGDVAATTMHHLFSYLKLNITPSNLDDTYVVNKVIIKGLGYNKATLDYDFDFENPLLTTDETGDITLTIENAEALEDGVTTTIPFTIVPFTTTGVEEITVELYFDDMFVGRSITITEVAAESEFEMGKYNDLNAAFDFATAESINPATYELSSFSETVYPDGNTWYISDTSASVTLVETDGDALTASTGVNPWISENPFDGLKAAIVAANSAGTTPEIIFLNLTAFPAHALNVNATTCDSSGNIGYGTSAQQKMTFKVYLPEATSIDMCGFYNCSGMSYLSAPKVTTIANSGLRACGGLTDYNLSAVEDLGQNSLNNLIVADIDFPNLTTLSGGTVFNACVNISTLELGTGDDCIGVGFIHQNAFNSIGGSGTEVITLTIREGLNSSDSYYVSYDDSEEKHYLHAKGTGNTYTTWEFKSITLDPIEYEEDTNVYSLSEISESVYPGGEIWYIGNETATVTVNGTPASGVADYTQNDFDGLLSAITAANAKNIKPNVIFTALSEVPDYAFYYKTGYNFSVELDVATTIGTGGFYNCTGITSVVANSVTTAKANGLRSMTGLKSVELDKLATVSGSAVMNGCSVLESISLPSLSTGHNSMFLNCGSLKSVSLPLLTTTGTTILSGCTALTEVYLGTSGSGITSMSTDTFGTEPDLTACTLYIRLDNASTVSYNEKVLSIDASTDVTFGSIVEVELAIPDYYECTLSEFNGSFSLEKMGYEWTILDETTDLVGTSGGTMAFSTLSTTILAANTAGVTPNLIFKSLKALPDYAFSIGSNTGNGTTAEFSIELTEATSIGAYAFARCTKITSVTAKKVETLGDSSFRNVGTLSEVYLPALKSTVTNTFRGSSNLVTITLPSIETLSTAVGSNEFNSCSSLTTINLGTGIKEGDSVNEGYAGLKSISRCSAVFSGLESQTINIKVATDANYTVTESVAGEGYDTFTTTDSTYTFTLSSGTVNLID